MCLAVPMKIVELDQFNARCEAKGVERSASLFMVSDEEFQVGDYVVIQLGYVVRKVSEEDAQAAWELFDQILEETNPPDA